jgi:alkylation response protein AidB-like acyl-CoA dehydrogenase
LRKVGQTLKRSQYLTQYNTKNVSLLVNSQHLNEEQVMIQDMAYEFAKDRLMPNAAEWDEKKHFPKDVFREAAEMGFAGIYTSEDVGG